MSEPRVHTVEYNEGGTQVSYYCAACARRHNHPSRVADGPAVPALCVQPSSRDYGRHVRLRVKRLEQA